MSLPRGLDKPAQDALLAAVLLTVAQAEVWFSPSTAGQRPLTAMAAAVMTGALAFRRRAPLATAVTVIGSVLTLGLLAEVPNAVFLAPTGILAMYSLGAHATSKRARVGLAAALVSLPLSAARTEDATVTDLTAPALLFAGAWAGGRSLRARRARSAELEDRTDRLVREQEERERLAAAEERRRIARELHDIVAHRVTTVVIQAESGAGRAEDPAHSQATFQTIADSGREALDELRRLLGLLRSEDGDFGKAPRPSLADLDQLAEDVRRAGLPVDMTVEGEVTGLPAGLDLTAYRIVQEALTNALRHSPTRAEVMVRRSGRRLQVEVRNPVDGAAQRDSPGSGRGLAGMRERARVYDGELTVSDSGGAWLVRADLPVAEPGA